MRLRSTSEGIVNPQARYRSAPEVFVPTAACYSLVALALFLGMAKIAAGATTDYVGSTTCEACHEDIFDAFMKSPHDAVETEARIGWKGRACESCHGPGGKHVQTVSPSDIRNPAKLAPAAVDETCLKCHLNQATPVGYLRSTHGKNQVACTVCHSIHGSSLVARTIPAINQLCGRCHANIWAQFQRPYHHKLPEEAMSCVDCHNPHGTVRAAMIQTFAANEPGCFTCHGDKRGPFTFEHGPVRFEGCTTCHEPHGSANPRMLVRHEVRFVCLECHANLPVNTTGTIGVVPLSFHDLRSPQFQNCTVCHQKIHGSYVDRDLLK